MRLSDRLALCIGLHTALIVFSDAKAMPPSCLCIACFPSNFLVKQVAGSIRIMEAECPVNSLVCLAISFCP